MKELKLMNNFAIQTPPIVEGWFPYPPKRIWLSRSLIGRASDF